MNLPEAVTIRAARLEDEATIRAMVRWARLDPTQLRWSQFLVVEEGNQVIGIGQLRRYGDAQELGSLVVVPKRQGSGIGGYLVHALIEKSSAALFLECRAALAPYYEKFGFRRVRWYEVPWPLKAKFGLSTVLASLFGGVASMRYEGMQERGADEGIIHR